MYEQFAQIYDRFMTDVDYESWAKWLCALYEKYGKSGQLTILDAACGTGSMTIQLAEAGHLLTGADSSEDMLREASEKARNNGFHIPFVEQEMQRLALHKKCDVVNCACDGVNYLLDEAQVMAFFSSAYDVLKPNGLLCFDVSSRYKLENILAGNIFGEDDGHAAYLWRNAYDEKSRLLEMQLSFFIKKGELYERFTERHIQRAHEQAELTAYLKRVGFAVVVVLETWSDNAPSPKSERIQFVAVKSDR